MTTVRLGVGAREVRRRGRGRGRGKRKPRVWYDHQLVVHCTEHTPHSPCHMVWRQLG